VGEAAGFTGAARANILINGRVGAAARIFKKCFYGRWAWGRIRNAIIEQGTHRADSFDESRLERRAIIEEAAGVTKFKTKKRLGRGTKLESSKLNLARVNDNCGGKLKSKLGSLKRQAAKAPAIFRKFREQMRGIVRDRWLAGPKAREMGRRSGADLTEGGSEEFAAAELQHATAISAARKASRTG